MSNRQAIRSLASQTAAKTQRLRDELYALSQNQGFGGGGTGAIGGYAVIVQSAGTYNAAQTAGRVVILCDCSAGAVTINLPTAIANLASFDVKKTDGTANTVTVDGSGAETIDGGATAVILAQYASLEIVSDNANWRAV